MDWANYYGQSHIIPLIKQELSTGKTFRHTILLGPCGCGKSALSALVAAKCGARLFEYVASDTWKPEQIQKMLLSLPIDGYDSKGMPGKTSSKIVVVVDEVHCMKGACWEAWYTALDSFHIYDARTGKPNWIPYFTLIACSNMVERIPVAFLDRLPLQLYLQPYTDVDVQSIIKANYPDMDMETAMNIARRSRGVPRRALSFAETVTMHAGSLQIFEVMGITEDGLEPKDLRYLEILKQAENPMSLGSMSAAMGESKKTIQDYIEPYLMRRGYIQILPGQGRQLTTNCERGRRQE
jgi:Holliday junction DNA helicase RuvB